ncbi:uncharacterized protein [Venturia canescens]|uniref:uncharacterized protein n=1 Tax=Venturia canescens TaxID=32260 RepID=UPI001C9CF348|nr:uncharacterized protein LOC122414594 [Venturia canescens]
MSVWAVLALLGLTAGLLVESAVPDPPTSGITTVGSLKLATAEDCAGVVAFSANKATNTDARLVFAETTMNKGVGYIAETGIFTTHCPGLYQFSFAGYGSDNLRISLKRKLNKSETWTTLVGAGPGGGSNLILINADGGDQFVVYVDAGKVTEGTTFSGYRFAKK